MDSPPAAEYSDHAPVSKPPSAARAARSPARTSRWARTLRPSTAASRSPLMACSSPLRIRSDGANEYMTNRRPPSDGTATPAGGGVSNAPSARRAIRA